MVGEEIDLKNDPLEELKKLFVDEKVCQLQVCNKKVLEHLKNHDINIANRAYALFSLIHIICAPGRDILNGKYLHNIDDMKNKNWATHAINTLVRGITSFKKGKGRKQNRLGGCVLFLQFFYMSKARMTPPSKDVQLLEYVKKNTVEKFLKKHEAEREDAELNERGAGYGKKKPKKQKVIDEEVIANSLKLKYKEFEEELEFCGKLYPHNETYKEIRNKMQILCDGTKITAESLLLLKKQETQNEDTVTKITTESLLLLKKDYLQQLSTDQLYLMK